MSETDKKPSLKERWQATMETYGRLAIIIYLSIFGLSIAGFFVAIKAGFQVEGGAEQTGTLVAAYVATKALQPVRILATLALVPLVDQVIKRRKAA